MHSRAWIDIEGVVNMRDVGGLPTTDGGHIAAGRLIRSDNLQDLSPASVSHLVDGLGVTDVVDLRTFVEVAKEGDGPLRSRPDVNIQHFTLYTEDTAETGIPAGERALPWVSDPRLGDPATDSETTAPGVPSPGAPLERTPPADAADGLRSRDHDAYWAAHYLGYLTQRPDSVVAALRAIAGSRGAVVVHCAAGKDRTGTIIGLALKAAGATDDAVIGDFEASAERVPQILARLSRRPAYADNLVGKTVDQQSPRADTMRRLLGALDDRFGGVEGWLGGQGWTSDDTARLRAKLRD